MKVYGLFLVSGLAVGSLYGLGGVGLVILHRATGVLNFAYGAIAAAAAMSCWQIIDWGWPEPVAWASAVLTGLILSLAYGRYVAPGLAWRDPAVKAVATLGFALIILGAVSFAWEDAVRKISLPTDTLGVRILGVRVTVTRMIVFFASLAIVGATIAYLERTRTGLHMRALANDRDHAALIGVPILKTETIAWSLSGALAGFTGLMYGDLVRLDPTVLTFMVIPAIAAAVCGRLRSLPITLLAGLVIGIIEAMLILVKPLAPLRSMTPFVVATIVILWMQRGKRLTFMSAD